MAYVNCDYNVQKTPIPKRAKVACQEIMVKMHNCLSCHKKLTVLG